MHFPYDLKYDLNVFNELFKIVETTDFKSILQDQKATGWESIFKAGIGGVLSRAYGAHLNYAFIHTWEEIIRKGLFKTESYVASTLFNMDSALECCVFGLNALGFAIDNEMFVNINKSEELKKIMPANIIGPKQFIKKGYELYFSNVSKHWNENIKLIKTITDQHDITKHRHFELNGGGLRQDIPKSIEIKYKTKNIMELPSEIVPNSEIVLSNNPKKINMEKQENKLSYLEEIAHSWVLFLEQTGEMIKKDIKIQMQKKKNP